MTPLTPLTPLEVPVETAAQASPPGRGALPSAEQLREITARDGIDAATALLYQSVLESPVHGPFIRRIAELRERPAPSPWRSEAALAVVPAASYRENPRTGADGRLFREQAERLGCPTDVVPLASTGTLQENARILCDWLAAQRGRPVILASLSKGGADVKRALAEPDAGRAFAGVAAWINLCGILDGTPMADWLLSGSLTPSLIRFYYRLSGQSPDFLRDLRYGAGQPLDFALRLPAHVRMVSLVGFPLLEHLSRSVTRRCHQRLMPLGPNDGGLILADVCALPGLIYPVWGADHYLQPKDIDVSQLTAAVLQYLDETLVDESLDETLPCRLPGSPRPR